MLTSLVRFSIRFRGVVIALACLLAGYGVWIEQHSKFDVFPEFAPPLVVIQTEAPGLSPEEVETLVTRPVENAVNGVGNLESIRSQSIQGLSVITAIFKEGTDIFRSRQMVAEVLAQAAGQMPKGVAPPTMAPLTSSTSVMLNVGLTSEQRSPMALRTFADWTLQPRLVSIAAYANWAVTLLASFIDERGLAFLGEPRNDLIAGLLMALVVIPTLGAASMWAWALWAETR